MPVEHLTITKTQLWLDTTLDTLIKKDSLESQLKLFLISCQVNNLSPKTIEFYAQTVAPFLAFCRDRDITNPMRITVDVVRLYLLVLQQRLKPVSVQDNYRGIKRFLNWLVEEGILKENPIARLRAPKAPKLIIQPFSREQIAMMLAVCNKTFAGCRDRAIVLMFLDSGLRLSELAGIALSDMDIEKGIIRVTGKGSKQRLVHIGRETQKAVLRYLLRRSDDWPCLWVTEERLPMKAGGIRQVIRRLGKRAGITGTRCSPHTFRHTFAITCLRNGLDEFNLQCLLGHTTLQMTRMYVQSLGAGDAIAAHEKASPVDNMRL